MNELKIEVHHIIRFTSMYSIFYSSSTMSKGQPKRRIMMTPWNIDSLNEIKLNYTRSEGLLFGLIGGGNDKFKISNASIEDTNGNM